MTESRISGAEEPRAMRVRLETVSFQIRTVVTVVSPLGLVIVTFFSCKNHVYNTEVWFVTSHDPDAQQQTVPEPGNSLRKNKTQNLIKIFDFYNCHSEGTSVNLQATRVDGFVSQEMNKEKDFTSFCTCNDATKQVSHDTFARIQSINHRKPR